MRRLLIAACAAAPLALAAGPALAQTTLSSSTSTPVATATAGDVNVTSAGSINVNTATPLITLNSNNAVVLDGALISNNTDGATGLLILGGHSGSVVSTTGSITLGEDYAATDSTNGDGVVEAPFATGTGKYGVRLTGLSAFTGSLSLAGGGITVKGADSYGISIEAPLVGALQVLEPVTILGDTSTGLRVIAPVSGFVAVSSTISATGEGAKAIDLQAAAQSLRIYGAMTSTGYSLTSRSSTSSVLAKVQATALDVQQGGSAVTVAGSLANGFFLATPPTGTVSLSTADVDGDGIADGSEGVGSITTYGSAPALVIGGAGSAITLGAIGTGDTNYGAIIRGTVLGSGVFDGVSATAMQIGAGGAVNIVGGLRNTGTISASSYEADATAIHILAGSTVPAILNDGAIGSTVSDSALTSGYGGPSAYGLLIESGASVSSLTVTGLASVKTSTIGNAGVTAAVIDRSGTLSTIVNEGTISATRSATDATTAITGANIALDLRANTTGVSLLQKSDTNTSLTYGSVAGASDTAVSTITPVTPSIVGDVLLGSGPNSVDLEAGSLTGTLDLGGGAASLILNGASSVYGALRYTGSALALAVNSGTLTQLEASTLKLSSLAVGSTGVLNLSVDAANGRASLLQVGGSATIAGGGKIGVRLLTSLPTVQTYTLITSPNLAVGESDGDLLSSSSFLIAASLHADATAGTVSVTLRPRTAAELGLNASEGSALSAVIDGSAHDGAVSAALLGATSAATFYPLYRQLLPEHSNGVFHAVDQATRAIADLSTQHNDLFKLGTGDSGLWMEEFLLGSRETRDLGQASETGGFGIVGGATTSDSNVGAFGLTFAYVAASTSDPDLTGDGSSSFSQIEAGLNWRAGWKGFEVSARGGGGYLWGVTRRQYVADATTLTSAVSRSTKGTWNAWTADARGMLAYRAEFNRFFVQPQLILDYVKLEQDAYTERFGGDGLNLVVGPRSADMASLTGSVLFGGKFGGTGAIRPTFEVGVRDVFSGDAGTVSAGFAAGGDSFALSSTPITGAGGLAKLGLKYAGSYMDVEVAAKAQAFDKYQEGDLKVAVSTRF